MMRALPVNISYIPESTAEMLRQSVLHLKLYYIPQQSSSCAEGKEKGWERRFYNEEYNCCRECVWAAQHPSSYPCRNSIQIAEVQ